MLGLIAFASSRNRIVASSPCAGEQLPHCATARRARGKASAARPACRSRLASTSGADLVLTWWSGTRVQSLAPSSPISDLATIRNHSSRKFDVPPTVSFRTRAGFHSTPNASLSSPPSVAPEIRNLADREIGSIAGPRGRSRSIRRGGRTKAYRRIWFCSTGSRESRPFGHSPSSRRHGAH